MTWLLFVAWRQSPGVLNVTASRGQLSNAIEPMSVTPVPMVAFLRAVQPLKAYLSILVTLSGIIMPSIPVQFWNA